MRNSWFQNPVTGNYLTIAAALMFQFLLIILPLVGPAGAVVPHARANFVAFLCALLLTGGLSVAALVSKLQRRKADGSSFPIWSPLLVAACLVMFWALVTGQLSV
jgi:hypothetical protein